MWVGDIANIVQQYSVSVLYTVDLCRNRRKNPTCGARTGLNYVVVNSHGLNGTKGEKSIKNKEKNEDPQSKFWQ